MEPRRGWNGRRYNEGDREALIALWEASDRICSKWLKPLIPVLLPALERHGRIKLADDARARLLAVSPATMDRLLSEVRLMARGGQRREPVMAAWGFPFDGRKVLLHLMAGSKEDAETVSAFFQDMWARGLGDPLLVVSDGASGIIKAIEVCFPRSIRQRCLAHRMRNLAAKVPEDLWPEFGARATAAYQAPSRKIARELAEGVVADYGTALANAVGCFMDDFEACIAHLRLPMTHRRATRTTNLLERLFVEERRRLKIIPTRSARRRS